MKTTLTEASFGPVLFLTLSIQSDFSPPNQCKISLKENQLICFLQIPICFRKSPSICHHFLGWYAKGFPYNHQVILATVWKSGPLFIIPWMTHTVGSHQVSYLYSSTQCSSLTYIQASTFILSYFGFNLENLTKQRNTEYILYITYTELRKPLMVPHLFVDDLTEK